jgi:meso-butanediol dehydrogenase/(S,S)-butanediol dehydrogenase/diacetyl reductase
MSLFMGPSLYTIPGRQWGVEWIEMYSEAFAGRTALVTGAGSGIGAATARRLAGGGAKVAVTDINLDAAEIVAEGIRRDGGAASAYRLDAGEPASIGSVVPKVESELGIIDILVNNAVTGSPRTFLDLTPEDWRSQMDVNLMGPFLCSQAVARRLIAEKRGGAIVNVASAAGLTAVPTYVAYVAAKHGLVGLTKSLAMELGPHGVRVNAVAPGAIMTPPTLAAVVSREDAQARLARDYPLRRRGEPEEVAALIAFLASDEAGFITGAVTPIDGGFLAGKGA